MKLISWNVNGLRACMQKGFLDFFQETDADIFCLQAGRFQIESFIQADEYGANFSLERIWANDEKEPRLTSMPQLFVDGQFSKGFYNFVRDIVGEVRKAMEICFCDGDYDEMECDDDI